MKKYNVNYNIGAVKYLLNFTNGIDKHKDGSEFWHVRSFSNKKALKAFIKSLEIDGYIERNF